MSHRRDRRDDDRRRDRSRSRSSSRDRKHARSSYDSSRVQNSAASKPAEQAFALPLSGKVVPPEELDINCCVRLGILNASSPVTREQVLSEIDSIKMLPSVETVVMEPPEHGQDWARIYFTTPADANKACADLNVPFRQGKWRHFVTQKLPLPGSLCGEIGTIPTFEAFGADPPDTVVVDTQEGYVFFSTDELYKTKGAEDFMETKRREGKIVRRLICKHFDPERRIPCRYGLLCTFVHVKACAMPRLLRSVTNKQKLRFPKNETDIQVSSWDFERRADTLIVRRLDPAMDSAQLQYMFEGCAGYRESLVGTTADGMRYGVVRFQSRDGAFEALAQTADSGLSISYYGCMEDVRRIQMHDPEIRRSSMSFGGVAAPSAMSNSLMAPSARGPPIQTRTTDRASPDITRREKTEPKLPFPPLPPGWEYGESRKTNQYYFFQPKTKNPTTWQHPVTNERYTF